VRTNQLVTVWKNKKGLRFIRIELGVYDTWVNAVIGPRKNLQGFVRWNYDRPSFAEKDDRHHQLGLCLKLSGYAPLIWIPKKPRTRKDLGVLVHECTHAALYVAEWIGEPVNPDQSETLAHTISWLMQSILEHA